METESNRLRLEKFGAYLGSLRAKTSFGQAGLAAEMTTRGFPTSQSLIAQVETGRISNPKQEFLELLAQILGADYNQMIVELVSEKYGCKLSYVISSAQPPFDTQQLQHAQSLLVVTQDILKKLTEGAQK